MKKQFFKVKQFADQTFSRAGKTEVLTDDLQAADKHVEQIKAALTGLSKRFPLIQGTNQDSAHKEKRLKKCPEYILGQTMLKNATEDGLMGFTLLECGRVQMALANETVEHEAKVDQYVAAPLQHIVDTDLPNILKQKQKLTRLISDMDSIKTRYQQASKHSAGGAGATKLDTLREELEEAEYKVEQCRDQLAADMFQLMSRETEFAQTIIQYVKLQRAYHESVLHCLEDLIPGLECYINDNEMKPVYGYPLEEHLRVTNRKIALPIQLCVSALLRLGMEEEGLFRIAGGASKLRRIKLSLDACCLTLPIALEYKDPHVVAGALKSYLRELPEPLLTYKLYPEWMAAAAINHTESRLRALWDVVQKLPQANMENLRFLIKFFAVLTKNQDINKMSTQNIAIVLAPNLIWSPQEMNISTANNSSLIVDQLITYADWFFPGEIDFDRDLEIGIVNGAEIQSTGMRRCISNSSLSDHGESPPQGSPKPATRRKNKPAPTPPGNTPDKHDKKCDDKPPPAPDKPPRPTLSATLNRATYRTQKHEVNTELVQSRENNVDKLEKNVENEDKHLGFESFTQADSHSTEHVEPRTEETFHYHHHHPNSSKVESSGEKFPIEPQKSEGKNNVPIGFDQINASFENVVHLRGSSDLESHEISLQKSKPILADKPLPSTLERRKPPVAAPRSITNVVCNSEDVELRKKVDGTGTTAPLNTGDRSSKPAIPERPAGLVRPSSLIRQYPRGSDTQKQENADPETGPLTLERAHVYSVDKQQVSIIQVRGNGNALNMVGDRYGNSASNLQRSPSVGSRPSSVSLYGDRSDKPPRPEIPEPPKAHARTRSEGNIIDVQTQTETVVVPKSPPQNLPASPRFHQRPPRPQPPPPPPPTARPKSEQERGTNAG